MRTKNTIVYTLPQLSYYQVGEVQGYYKVIIFNNVCQQIHQIQVFHTTLVYTREIEKRNFNIHI